MMIHTPIHPGKIVKEICVIGAGLTVTTAAHKLGVDRTTFSRLINGHTGISTEMAIRLSLALKSTPPTFWLNLQRDYDLWALKKAQTKFHVELIKEAA